MTLTSGSNVQVTSFSRIPRSKRLPRYSTRVSAWRGDESPEERLDLLEQALEVSGVKLAEAVPLIAEMLELPDSSESIRRLMFAPDQEGKRQLADLAAWSKLTLRDCSR